MREQDLFVDLDGCREELEREGNPLTELEGLPWEELRGTLERG